MRNLMWLLLLGAPLPMPSLSYAQTSASSSIIAIDILLEPDVNMVANARTVNTRLRQNYPQGYALDATHLPHITLVQRYIRSANLEAVKAAVAKVLESQPISSLHFTTSGYITNTWGDTGIVLYNVERITPLLRLETRIVEAVQPFAVSGGTASAFVQSPGEQIDPKTIQWVEEFVPVHSGANYEPHVTLGLAHPEFLKSLKDPPFSKFNFRPVSLSIYQLGNVGTAQKKLADWPANPN